LSIAAIIIGFTLSVIKTIGYPGIFLLMVLEGMLLPIPSEVVMLFGGYLSVDGGLTAYAGIPQIVWVLISGTTGNVLGATLAYYIGKFGGIAFIMRYGRYLLIDEKSVSRAQTFFTRYGGRSVFTTRLLPIFRTFISIPAGIASMNMGSFLLYTASGTLLWNIVLTYLGVVLKSNWEAILPYFDYLTYVALAAIAILILLWAITAVRKYRKTHPKKLPSD